MHALADVLFSLVQPEQNLFPVLTFGHFGNDKLDLAGSFVICDLASNCDDFVLWFLQL